MAFIGPDLRGGFTRCLFQSRAPGGLLLAFGIAVGLLVLNQLFQWVCGVVVYVLMYGGGELDQRNFVKATLVGLFPASLITAAAAFALARVKGGKPSEVMSLRWPQLGPGGWLFVLLGFVVIVNLLILLVVNVLQIDVAQYTPGANGESPESGSAGIVKEAMFDIANEPRLFLLVLPSVALGAPIAEELIFRGQLFTALRQSRLGFSGATVVTALAWSLLHVTEPWLTVGLIFGMGLVFGWMMYRFGSLWVTLACHAVWNTSYSLLIFSGLASQ